ncbi:hypothetical protein ACJX0J_024939, partial [Zea mays]
LDTDSSSTLFISLSDPTSLSQVLEFQSEQNGVPPFRDEVNFPFTLMKMKNNINIWSVHAAVGCYMKRSGVSKRERNGQTEIATGKLDVICCTFQYLFTVAMGGMQSTLRPNQEGQGFWKTT